MELVELLDYFRLCRSIGIVPRSFVPSTAVVGPRKERIVPAPARSRDRLPMSLVTRCKCGRVISADRLQCRACHKESFPEEYPNG